MSKANGNEPDALRSQLADAVAEFKAERQAKSQKGIAEAVKLLESEIDRLRDVDLMTWPEIAACFDRIGMAVSAKVLSNEYSRLKARRARRAGKPPVRPREREREVPAALVAHTLPNLLEQEVAGASVAEGAVDIVKCHDGREAPRGTYVLLRHRWTLTDDRAWWDGQKNRSGAPRVPIEQVDDLFQALQRKKRDLGYL